MTEDSDRTPEADPGLNDQSWNIIEDNDVMNSTEHDISRTQIINSGYSLVSTDTGADTAHSVSETISSGSQILCSETKVLNSQTELVSCVNEGMSSRVEEAADTTTYRKVAVRVDLSGSLTSDDVLDLLEDKVQNLLRCEDCSTDSAYHDLKFIQRRTRYTSDVTLHRRTIDRLVRAGVAHVYLRVWQMVSSDDRYLSPSDARPFTVLQTALSIVWNCSDSSPALCESLARVAVVHLLLSELGTARLHGADLETDERRRYLVKSYLGILHNVARLCADSRKMFRSADGVTVLSAYMDRPQGLVRTKAYLILSYIVTEEENDVINATDENLEYIVQILRAALEGENHFSVEYAFWAAEISCGLNHLAVNDSNKARLCRLGIISLYVKMLRGGRKEEGGGGEDSTDLPETTVAEEQSLAAAGLWILSFHPENKLRMKQVKGCIEALQVAASGSLIESVARAARGALWVIGSSRPQSVVSMTSSSATVTPASGTALERQEEREEEEAEARTQEEDDDRPHVMISYHWASQRYMIRVKEYLVALNYKVWMDIDNMSGSTLEAMALAVEKAAVVVVAMSQGYKDSPSCRTEAEYTYRLRKDIVPLVLQAGYVPDGWLGILVGTRLYFDLSDPVNFDAQLERLAREIGARGRLMSDRAGSCTRYARSVSGYSSCAATCSRGCSLVSRPQSGSRQQSEISAVSCDGVFSPISITSSLTSPTSLHAYPSANQLSARQQPVLPATGSSVSCCAAVVQHSPAAAAAVMEAAGWSRSDVCHWLDSLQLAHLAQRLKDFDGVLLLQYRHMLETAPQFFYHTLEDILSLDLVDMLHFSAALQSLT